MGLLDQITGYVDHLKRQAGNALRETWNDPGGLLMMRLHQLEESLPPQRESVMPGADAGGLVGRPTMADLAMGVALNAPTMGLLGHTVYHGSPHKFDKFDASKIGTGEGAQAYGHGVYLAESRGVANSYRENLSDRVFNIGGKELRGPVTKYGVADPNAARAYMSVPEKMATYALDAAARAKSADPAKDAIAHLTKYGKKNKDAPAAIDLIRQWSDEGARVQQGNLYKVDLPDEWLPKMLDWDKPLSQQPEAVKDALLKVGLNRDVTKAKQRNLDAWDRYQSALKQYGNGDERTARAMRDWQDAAKEFSVVQSIENLPGSQIYIDALGPRNDPAVAQRLRDAGIPGIRYLDGGSRKSGEGTYNYVVFPGNEGLLKILNIE